MLFRPTLKSVDANYDHVILMSIQNTIAIFTSFKTHAPLVEQFSKLNGSQVAKMKKYIHYMSPP